MKITEHRFKVAVLRAREPPQPKVYAKKPKEYFPVLEDMQPTDDPLEDVADTGSVQGNARAELAAVQTAFYKRRDKTSQKSFAHADTEYWFAAIFETRDQKDHFLRAIGLYDEADKYIDGRSLAEHMGVELPASDIDWDMRPGNWTKRDEGGS